MQQLKQLRQLNAVIDEWRAAADIVQSTAAALALNNIQVGAGNYGAAWFGGIYFGAYYMIDRAVNSLPMTGKVPLPLFQLLAAIRSRPVHLSGNRGFTLNVMLSGLAQPAFWPPQATYGSITQQKAGFSELIQCYAQLGGILVDLDELADSGELDLGKLGVVSFGKSTGPLNQGLRGSDSTVEIQRVDQIYPVSESWMKYVDWLVAGTGAITGIQPDYVTDVVKFPIILAGTNVGSPVPATAITYQAAFRPVNVVLTRAMTNAGIFSCSKIVFPAWLTVQLDAFLAADALKRGLTVTANTPMTFGSLLLAARVGVESGQLSMVWPLFDQTRYQLPQVLCEALTATGSYRNGVARLPYVAMGTTNVGLTASYAYYYTPGTLFNGSAFWAETVTSTCWLYPLAQQLNSDKTYAATQNMNAWNAPPTTTALVGFDFSLFSQTISLGPLGQPGVDRSVGRLNMNDVYCEWNAGSSGGVSVISICCNGKKVRTPDFKLLSLFPMALDFFVETNGYLGTDMIDEGTPLHREILYLPAPAVNYSLAAVTEDSAKYTELQSFIQELNERGLGGDQFLSDIAGGGGRLIRAGGRFAKGVGFPTTGKILHAVARFVLEYEQEPKKAKPKNGTKKENDKKVVPQRRRVLTGRKTMVGLKAAQPRGAR